jgi:hypothetical protein
MKNYFVQYSKGQIKIQEMAFVLVTLLLFFIIGGIFLLNYLFQGNEMSVIDQRQEKAAEMALKLVDLPELAWSSDNQECASCIDWDKALIIKDRTQKGEYKEFWSKDIGNIIITQVYPELEGECNKINFPNCREITLLNRSSDYVYSGAYVALCRSADDSGRPKCTLGKILVSGMPL